MSDLSQPTPTGHQRTTGGNFRWEPPTPEELQAMMPGYTIEKILGRGGMGAVYKGVQQNLDRTVAIKVLPPGVEKEDPSFAERFKSEAKLMAKLNHPAVVAVYDFGTTLGGQLYFAMEYVDGSDVSQMIRSQGKLPPEHALAITAHVCDALAAAHELGIVHRDIKPANVLLNMKGQVKVADFGLAKVEEPGQHGLTKTGYAMGTPDFVAPEVLMLGSSIDGRADLYAVGVMLYQMLTGEVPRGAFKPATARIPGLDRRYDPIIIKAMQSDREERYQSSAELRRDLDVILTVPLVQQDDPASAAIPVSQVAQMPAQRSAAQKPVGKPPQPRSADAPVRQPNIKAGEGTRAPAKSKAPLFIGLGIAAAVAIGAIIMFSGGKKPAPSVVQASGLPVKAAGTAATPSPAPAKTTESPKAESKPAVVSKPAPAVATAITPKVEPPKPPAAMPAAAASASSDKFPPGQWVKVFTAEDSAPPDAMWRDGWLESIQPFGIPNFAATNMGVRMTLKTTTASSSKGYVATLKIRGTSDSAGPGNFLRLWKDGILTCGFIPASIPAQTADSVDLAKKQIDIKQGGPVSLEYSVVTTHLFAKIDGSLMIHAQDQDVHNGTIRIYSSNPIRDIEVINLDGLSEAEALRILGVDEKGNDTRAAALAAAKAMEQKQVAQAAASIPELATLDEQFKKLTAERVTAPFEAEVAKLNSGYLGGLDRKMAEEKAAGHLDSVLALEAEKKLIEGYQGVTTSSRQPASDGRLEAVAPCPLPSAEDDATSTTTPAVLKGLRQIYREAYAKIEATRAANLKTLTDPLTTRLKLLESDLTKKDRIADAKTVKEYREGLQGVTASSRQPSDPRRLEAVAPSTSPAALKDGFTNSLGMKFVPVKGTDVLFCIHETRYKDYAAYAAEAQGVDGTWKDQTIDGYMPTENKENHPAMNIRWEDAHAFCAWLSKKEGKTYRLPTDEEWSVAVGLGDKEKRSKGATPAMLNEKENTEFPWGGSFPPKTKDKAENYSDASRKAKVPTSGTQYIEDYDDGFPTTAPVMSFKPNKFGLYDMGGNVTEWCEDWFDAAQKDRVQRGVGWGTSTPNFLLSSHRYNRTPNFRGNGSGFRIVVETRSPSPTTKPATPPPPPTAPPPAPATAAKSDFSNSLGMKFVKVPGTQVLFCIHETRRQDYAAYAAEVPEVNGSWKNQQMEGIPAGHEENHPVVGVSWDDANDFSAWLSKKEGRKYRLPTDKEWSFAVGIGREEKRTKDTTPEMLHGKVYTDFPWGGPFPPKTKDLAGNYADTSWKEKFPAREFIEGYTDGFATTAPVMSFKPNRLGIYDLGGNVQEWVEDWWNGAKSDRVLRGDCWYYNGRDSLLSSGRRHDTPDHRNHVYGFRIVVEMTAP